MSTIKSLSKETIKLINSTQVISSIYSAIKELVENSLDAQAQNIEVNLVDNGLALIEVKDNGIGINRDDAQYMALSSYTSKITDFNDLDLLSTYGFRGEGLSSICQVADVKISTKTANDITMICHTLNNEGHIIASELSHGLTGTIVQMRNLFKNMPVRRNILNNRKRINQEIKAIELLLKMYAICKPSIRFMLRVNSNNIFTKVNCKTVVEAIKMVFGVQLFSKLSHIEKNVCKTEIHLFIPKKDVKDCIEVSQAGLQFLCVNDRPIRSKEIEKKINKRISEHFNKSNTNKFVYCLILKVDPTMLDVNLEPNKDKVFIQNEAIILNEIDNCLISFYELQDSQMSSKNDIENINCNENLSESEKDILKEKEWPACKKRKLNLKDKSDKNSDIPNQATDDMKNKSNNDFLKTINGPILSDSDSNDVSDYDKILRHNDKESKMEVEKLNEEVENSELFDYAQNIRSKDQIEEETLSQLPKVDLGDDFDWQEIINKNNTISKTQTDSTEVILDKTKTVITDAAWSKGQVPGLKSGVSIGFCTKQNNFSSIKDSEEIKQVQLSDSESFDFHEDVKKINDSEEPIQNENTVFENQEFKWDVDINNTKKRASSKNNCEKQDEKSKKVKKSYASIDSTQTKIPFAGDNACLTSMGPSAFAMYCAEARTQILRNHPELTPAEVAVYMNRQWKEISSEEREYYRDLANQQNQSMNNTSLSQTIKRSKPQLSQAEKEKNRKQLVNALENMKVNKNEVKKESIIMRTFASWNISMHMIKEKYQKLITNKENSVVGSLNSLFWIVNLKSKLFVFNIIELHSRLNVTNYDKDQVNADYVTDLVEKWINEKNDMSLFYPLNQR